MVTIRPSPPGRMAVNAARQHRKEPVRFTRSVSFPALRRDLGERCHRQHGGRAHQSGDCAHLRSSGEEALDVFDVADVRGRRGGVAARVADVPGDDGESLAITGREHDMRTCCGHGLGGRPLRSPGLRP